MHDASQFHAALQTRNTHHLLQHMFPDQPLIRAIPLRCSWYGGFCAALGYRALALAFRSALLGTDLAGALGARGCDPGPLGQPAEAGRDNNLAFLEPASDHGLL